MILCLEILAVDLFLDNMCRLCAFFSRQGEIVLQQYTVPTINVNGHKTYVAKSTPKLKKLSTALSNRRDTAYTVYVAGYFREVPIFFARFRGDSAYLRLRAAPECTNTPHLLLLHYEYQNHEYCF